MNKTRKDVIRELENARKEKRIPTFLGWDLQCEDLSGLDLRDANCLHANLLDVNLQDTYLSGRELEGTNLREKNNIILQCRGLRSGEAIFSPTPDGWNLVIVWRRNLGPTWSGTLDEFRTMIAKDGAWEGVMGEFWEEVMGPDWPKVLAEECAQIRPELELLIRMCELHINQHEGVIEALNERWNKANNQ